MVDADKRQQNKGYLKVIDIEDFEKNNNKFVFTCGSGVTASVLAYAYKMVNNDYQPIIYDGSWSEYGKYSP